MCYYGATFQIRVGVTFYGPRVCKMLGSNKVNGPKPEFNFGPIQCVQCRALMSKTHVRWKPTREIMGPYARLYDNIQDSIFFYLMLMLLFNICLIDKVAIHQNSFKTWEGIQPYCRLIRVPLQTNTG